MTDQPLQQVGDLRTGAHSHDADCTVARAEEIQQAQACMHDQWQCRLWQRGVLKVADVV